MKVDNKESVVGLDPLPTFIILLTLDPSITTCKFGPKTVRDGWDIHSVDLIDEVLGPAFLFHVRGVLEVDEAKAPFDVHPVKREGLPNKVTHAPGGGGGFRNKLSISIAKQA